MKSPFNFGGTFDYHPKNNRKRTRGRNYKFITVQGKTHKVWIDKENTQKK